MPRITPTHWATLEKIFLLDGWRFVREESLRGAVRPAPSAVSSMDPPIPPWRLKGWTLDACNCDYGCPCVFNAPPTRGYCQGGWNWHVTEGLYGQTRLEGLTFALFAAWPGALHEGNGEALLLVDERADQAQRRAIDTLLSGHAGGPWSVISTTLSRIHGPEYVPFEVKLDGVRSAVRAGTLLELEMEPIRNPVTGAETFPQVILPEGFVYKESLRAASRSFRVSGGVSYEHPGKNAAFAPFDYRGP